MLIHLKCNYYTALLPCKNLFLPSNQKFVVLKQKQMYI